MRVVDEEIWTSDFMRTAEQAANRAIDDLGRLSPTLAAHVSNWLSQLSDVSDPSEYFTRPYSLPVLALPWWLEKRICGEVDSDFQTDLMYSTISGYYFTRMLDDVMDGHQFQRAALPALFAFHKQLIDPYYKYFSSTHPFWREFERMLMTTAEAASLEATLAGIDAATFLAVSARKSIAALIPVAAVCFRYDRPALLQSWEDFFTLYGRWHQMHDDLFDWSKDLEAANNTWLLCEAERQRRQGESVSVWMGREGYKWAEGVMECWMGELITTAGALESKELLRYLKMRRLSFSRDINRMIATAAAFARLLQVDSYCSE